MKLNLAINKYLSSGGKLDNLQPESITINYDKFRHRTITKIEFSHLHEETKRQVFTVSFKGHNDEKIVETYIAVNVEVQLDNKYFR